MEAQRKIHEAVSTSIGQGDYAAAINQLQAGREDCYREKDRILYFLDMGMLCHFAGRYRESNDLLGQADEAIAAAYTRSVRQAAASFMLNDNVLEYPGEDYEDIYLNVFKALNYLGLNEPKEAFVEVRRIAEKLSVMEGRYVKVAEQLNTVPDRRVNFKAGATRFHNSALARFLSLIMYRADGNLDDARIDTEKIEETWRLSSQIYSFPMPAIRTALAPSGQPRLTLLAFAGRTPEKMADTMWIHTFKDRVVIARSVEVPSARKDCVDVIPWPGVKPDLHVKLEVPYLFRRPSQVGSVRAVVDDRTIVDLARLESLENVAMDTFAVKRPLIYVKTLSRVVLKVLLAETTIEETTKKEDQSTKDLVRMATYMALAASESADLRATRYIPGQAWMADVALSPGAHAVRVEYLGPDGQILHTQVLPPVEVRQEWPNLAQSAYLN